MKRDVRLHGLSSDHHNALVLARTIERAFKAGQANQSLVDMVMREHKASLMRHFEIEEQLLLPPLAEKGEGDLVSQVLAEHVEMRAFLESAEAGDVNALEKFGALLFAHVRLEERSLFTKCEEILESEILDRVAVQAPKPSVK
ncbi:MAG: hemerythrin domain-containing protein [Kofleriaceae bacterium]|nr:hemerythrin domain-containing protein [Kofleriaceae bacterium]